MSIIYSRIIETNEYCCINTHYLTIFCSSTTGCRSTGMDICILVCHNPLSGYFILTLAPPTSHLMPFPPDDNCRENDWSD